MSTVSQEELLEYEKLIIDKLKGLAPAYLEHDDTVRGKMLKVVFSGIEEFTRSIAFKMYRQDIQDRCTIHGRLED